MRIMLTGATGFIGRAFIRSYPNYHYTCLVRDPLQKVRGFRGSITDRPRASSIDFINSLSLLKTLDGFDAIINLAGEPIAGKRWTERRKLTLVNSRCSVTRHLVQLIKASNGPPQTFITGSAIGVYGNGEGRVIDETSETEKGGSSIKDDFSAHLCQQWESEALQARGKTRLVIVRTGVVLGQGGALSKMLPSYRWGFGSILGTGEQYVSWIHLDDTVRAINHLLTNEKCEGAYNLTAPNPVTNRMLCQAVGNAVGQPHILVRTPEWLLKLVMGEASHLILDSQFVVPKRLICEEQFKFQYDACGQAVEAVVGSWK